jgi:SAM-dependent methyltransferase
MHAANNRPMSFRGVRQIFLYNWHFYAATVVFDLAAAVLIRFSSSAWMRLFICVIAVAATFWALSSLLVSHYVYDRSPLCQWNWLRKVLKEPPGHWANIHAGLDQTSESLMQMFPDGRRRVLDIYVRSEMGEPSIERARRSALPAAAAEAANPFALPLENGECDAVFVIFAAHELRKRKSRIQFFREILRALTANGCVVLVEHLRDWKNFLAYGPGALHFFSRREWLGVGSGAGFSVSSEIGVTPFVRCFVLAKTAGGSTVDLRQNGNAPCD